MTSNRTSRNRRCRDHGMALVIVLGSAALFAVLAAMMITSAQTSRIVTKVNTERSQMKYAAESALAYGQWMIMSDRRRFPNRRLGFRDIQREAVDTESWMADGKRHDVWVTDGILAHVRVLDAARGWDFSTPKAARQTRQSFTATIGDDEERRDQLDAFFDVLEDYLDGNDEPRELGMERDEYSAFGLEEFPRNDRLSLREEIYWLPNIELLIPRRDNEMEVLPQDLVRIVPPRNVGNFTGKPNVFSSSEAVIRTAAGIDGDEMVQLQECIQSWYEVQTPLEECLYLELFNKLNTRMSLRAFGVYTIEVRAGYNNGDITRRMVATLDLRNLPKDHVLYWQKITY